MSSTTASQTRPLEIVLLVCPTCRRPSKVDATAFKGTKGKAWCAGPIDARHRSVKCQPMKFKEVVGA